MENFQQPTLNNQHPVAMSFYDKAVWYVLAVPFVTVFVVYASAFIAEKLPISPSVFDDFGQVVIVGALLVQPINFIFGIVICCMVRSHKRKLTIWMALLSLAASCAVEFFAFVGLVMSNLGHNC